ncbi:MAG: hypothetical protein BSOLF_0831 [Candidatus Carbobacillus altaicus]|uniref:Uncharacterized protein n=1 Tax=Candidatus Carbonibacillus altaicus TaxID=2163959 RepID=A0A2R6Y073_9BACL|nr:MAG: hypothetical protein BSOLF_0831 [Candidatus Carbobacillus altaicus]
MHGKVLWDELERRAKAKYRLGDDYFLCGVDLADEEVARVSLCRKGPRGGISRKHTVHGVVVWIDLNEYRKERRGDHG